MKVILYLISNKNYDSTKNQLSIEDKDGWVYLIINLNSIFYFANNFYINIWKKEMSTGVVWIEVDFVDYKIMVNPREMFL
jgi:hypothetical protein